jgi:hypothetical protein
MSKLVERREIGGGYVDLINDGTLWYRHAVVRDGAGDAERAVRRLRASFKEWGGEAFHFTEAEHEWLKAQHPQLFDDDLSPQDKRLRWIDFGASSIGRHFRVDSKWRN